MFSSWHHSCRWLLNPFSLCSKEQRNVCIPSQCSCLHRSPTAFGEVCSVVQKPTVGAQPSSTPARWSPQCCQKRRSFAFHLDTPPPSPCASPSIQPATRPANSANFADWRLTLPKGEEKRRGGLYQDQSSRGTAGPTAKGVQVSAEGKELPFGRRPAVGQLQPVVKPHIHSAPELLRELANSSKPRRSKLHCWCVG